MNFEAYERLFFEILSGELSIPPYNNADYLDYVKLNFFRQQRWLKTGVLQPQLVQVLKEIKPKLRWTVITEPWCGDSAHTIPFIHLLSKANPLIEVDYQLRDEEPFLINSYLTNGSKSIPKLIVKEGNHLVGVWGPRPIKCQLLYEQLMHDHVDHSREKMALQQWYNTDKGESFQKELLIMLLNPILRPLLLV
ncbi:MAG TPA: thioredoxin family protein [Mucilaginibacter sp.]|jgi:hypothetical protein